MLVFVIIGLVALFVFARLAVPIVSPRPDNLGVTDGSLAPCPNTPNCYASNGSGAPIPYEGTQADAHARIVTIINSMERTEIITNTPDYVHAEFKSALWGFIDDVEFYFDDTNNLIHYRSAARLGQGDMGVNKKRIEDIRGRFLQG